MSKEQFEALIPYISADLIKLIADKENIPHDDAILKLYSSKLYELLEEFNDLPEYTNVVDILEIVKCKIKALRASTSKR